MMLPIFDDSQDCPGDPNWILMGKYALQAYPVDDPASLFLRALQAASMPAQTQMRILATIKSIAADAGNPCVHQKLNPTVHIYLL